MSGEPKNSRSCGILAVGAACAVAVGLAGGEARAQAGPGKSGPELTISACVSHENLAVFLIHGEDRIKGKEFLTLSEALKQGKAVIEETGNVRQLAIRNGSDAYIYVQAGDIVRGGRQDRALPFDLILAPKSGKVPLESFCVEQGRWTARGNEDPTKFSGSDNNAMSAGFVAAAQVKGDQGAVWEEVAKAQAKLTRSVGAGAVAATSPSSLELTLSSRDVQASLGEYLDKLQKVGQGKEDVIGLAVAVNGKIHSADIYACGALFRKMWPKLLKGAAVEALAHRQKDLKFAVPTVAAVRKLLAESGLNKQSSRTVAARTTVTRRESTDKYVFDTRAGDFPQASLHRRVMARSAPEPPEKE